MGRSQCKCYFLRADLAMTSMSQRKFLVTAAGWQSELNHVVCLHWLNYCVMQAVCLHRLILGWEHLLYSWCWLLSRLGPLHNVQSSQALSAFRKFSCG